MTEGASEKEHDEEEAKGDDEETAQSGLSFDNLTLKMKALLRRKSDTDRRTEKKWKNLELQRMETSHWTEL